jgi:alkylation response protein AidB-like acyl-CoA dehydrogenase
MRYNALRGLTSMAHGDITPETAIHKLYWANFHQALGELAVDVLGAEAAVVPSPPYELSPAQRLFLYTRADTIYGGSDEIQRNVIGERALGLPPEPKVTS